MMDIPAVTVSTGDEESVTFTVKVEFPVVVGVPLTTPVAEFSVRPAGSEPADTKKVYGALPPEAVSVYA
jgi:hypothetical protein